jgi:hypothetical protein
MAADGSVGLAPVGIGHNGGPPFDPGAGWRYFCWKKAHAAAWKTPPREIALARLARAEALGMTYREYNAVLLDTGVHLRTQGPCAGRDPWFEYSWK